MSDMTTKVLIEIRDKISSVDQGLNRLREEHGAILQEHGKDITRNSEAIEQLGRDVDQHMTANGQVLRQILGAVEYGNRQRDIRVEDIEARVTRIEEHLDLPLDG